MISNSFVAGRTTLARSACKNAATGGAVVKKEGVAATGSSVIKKEGAVPLKQSIRR